MDLGMAWDYGRGTLNAHKAKPTKESISTTRNADMGSTGGGMVICIKAISSMTLGTAMEKCIGVMGPITRECGNWVFRMEKEKL